MSGSLSGEFHLTGAVRAPLGFGVDDDRRRHGLRRAVREGRRRRCASTARASASTTSSLAKAGGTIDRRGVRRLGRAPTRSTPTGAASRWSSIAAFAYPDAQPSGLIEFTAGGSGTFDVPRYDVRFRVERSVRSATRRVGQVTGTLALRGNELSGEIDAASPRLAVTGTGRIALTPQADAELTFRFHDSSLDPYVRLFVPKLSPFTTAVASGSIRVGGRARRRRSAARRCHGRPRRHAAVRLRASATRAPIRLALDQHVVRVEDLQLVGEDTQLDVGGTDRAARSADRACGRSGDANLGILQGFFRDVRGSGRARADRRRSTVRCTSRCFPGSATITDGRVRHFSLPNSLDAINGVDPLRFARAAARRCHGDDGRRPRPVRRPRRLRRLPARRAERHRARRRTCTCAYPEGVRSTVDADLSVRGNVKAPTLGGTVTVEERASGTGGSIRPAGCSTSAAGRSAGGAAGASRQRDAPVPLRFDIQVLVPSTLRIENNLARLVASADLQLRGTYDRPLLFGRAEVDRGEVTFEGRRYLVTRGAHRVHQPDADRAVLRRRGGDAGARARARPTGSSCARPARWSACSRSSSSDPPLPAADVLALLFSDVRRDAGPAATPSCARCRTRTSVQRDILTTRATQLLANPISSEVGRVVEQTFGVDTFQLTPSLIDPYQPVDRPRESVGAGHDRQAHLRSRLPDVFAQPQHLAATIRSCCSNTTRAIGSRGFCRATKIRPTRSRSA